MVKLFLRLNHIKAGLRKQNTRVTAHRTARQQVPHRTHVVFFLRKGGSMRFYINDAAVVTILSLTVVWWDGGAVVTWCMFSPCPCGFSSGTPPTLESDASQVN